MAINKDILKHDNTQVYNSKDGLSINTPRLSIHQTNTPNRLKIKVSNHRLRYLNPSTSIIRGQKREVIAYEVNYCPATIYQSMYREDNKG